MQLAKVIKRRRLRRWQVQPDTTKFAGLVIDPITRTLELLNAFARAH